MKFKVFVDGQHGTTGLKIHELSEKRDEIELLEIDEKDKKNIDKIDKIDYNTNGCCMAPSFKERENCLHSHFIYILRDNCEYFNVITRKCMRPDDGK